MINNKIKERWRKCHRIPVKCVWKMSENHINLKYLNDACYLSNNSELYCPESTRKFINRTKESYK